MNKIETLKDLKDLLNKLDETAPIEFKTTDNKKLLFYAIGYGGILADNIKSFTVPQSIVLKEI